MVEGSHNQTSLGSSLASHLVFLLPWPGSLPRPPSNLTCSQLLVVSKMEGSKLVTVSSHNTHKDDPPFSTTLLQIFDCPRLKFSEIPQRLTALLLPPDPIVINHVIR